MTKTETTGQIRPYGPGKFNTVLDSYVYSVSLDGGCDEEAGDVQTGRWYGLLRQGRALMKGHDPRLTLNRAEQDQLTGSAGVILSEDSQGFVDVEYFATRAELDAAWAEIEQAEQEQAEDDSEDSEQD